MSERKPRHKTYRERYFEDYQKSSVPAANHKGWKTEYRYIGLWKSWTSEERDLPEIKRRVLYMELGSIALFFMAAISGTALTVSRWSAGLGILSIAAWLAELSGVIRFVCKGHFVKELVWEEIDHSIRIGCPIRGTLVVLSVLAGLADCLNRHTALIGDIPVALALLSSAALSFAVYRQYGRLQVDTLRNEEGKAGMEF